MITTITVYDRFLIINTAADQATSQDLVRMSFADGDRHLLMDTGKNLGISYTALSAIKRAVELGRTHPTGHLEWADLDPTKRHAYLEWEGGPNRILRLDLLKVGCGYTEGPHVTIVNQPPLAAVHRIEQIRAKDTSWRAL